MAGRVRTIVPCLNSARTSPAGCVAKELATDNSLIALSGHFQNKNHVLTEHENGSSVCSSASTNANAKAPGQDRACLVTTGTAGNFNDDQIVSSKWLPRKAADDLVIVE